ncbi:MAG: hypothetical protein ACJAWV_000105 [Flammeovirgaceae bacterium]|jgi:hypothetical protein
MKIKIAVLALMIFGFSSCVYKTCPTYAKKDVKKVEVEKSTQEQDNM